MFALEANAVNAAIFLSFFHFPPGVHLHATFCHVITLDFYTTTLAVFLSLQSDFMNVLDKFRLFLSNRHTPKRQKSKEWLKMKKILLVSYIHLSFATETRTIEKNDGDAFDRLD